MSNEVLSKKLAQQLLEIKGECRGVNLIVDWDYIRKKKGEEGLKKLEDKIAEVGCPIKKYEEIKPVDFYPVGLDAISILAIRDVFSFSDKEIEEMGASTIRSSLFMKILFKYFVSLKLIAEQVTKVWSDHYTIGKLTMPSFDVRKGFAVVRLEDFQVHPIMCPVFKGSFGKTAELVVNQKTVCKETKCSFRGNDYHQFLITWEIQPEKPLPKKKPES